MTEQRELERLLKEMWALPTDEMRGIAADAALDAGDEYLTECLHWMVDEKKIPHDFSGTYTWFVIGDDWNGNDPNSDLPFELFKRFTRYSRRDEDKDRRRSEYRTNKKAELALFRVWKEARLSGWNYEE